MNFQVPASIEIEHGRLHAELDSALKAGGRIAVTAKRLALVLHPHFEKENAHVLPLLSLLGPLLRSEVAPEMRDFLELSGVLRVEMPGLLEGHRRIKEALKEMTAAALDEGLPEYIHFAEQLITHARFEEEIIYPAAWLAGEYIKAKAPVWS